MGTPPITLIVFHNCSLDTIMMDWAFTFTEQRLVDKTGCISFSGIPWEVGEDLIEMKVEVAYRPSNPRGVRDFP